MSYLCKSGAVHHKKHPVHKVQRLLLLITLSALCVGCATVEQRAQALSWRGLSYSNDPGGTNGKLALEALEQRADRLGASVTYGDLKPLGYLGLTHEHTIAIEQSLSTNGRLQTLAHELAHLLQPPNLSYVESEVFAELVASKVCAQVGVDTRDSSARYLARRKSGFLSLHLYKHDVEWAVKVLSVRDE